MGESDGGQFLRDWQFQNPRRTMLKFDPNRLNLLERDAWMAEHTQFGEQGTDELFSFIVQWAVVLVGEGQTIAEIRETVIGTFYDDMGLIRQGQKARNRTIMLAKAMVEQAIEALCPRRR